MMRASKLPDKKEWEKIVDEAFSSCSEHRFSQGYNSRKYAMIRGITMKRKNVDNTNKHGARRIALTVAAAAAAFTLVPASIFLAGHSGGSSAPMTNMDELAETTAPEEATDPVETETETEYEETITLTDVACYGFKQLQLNYVPEGLVYHEDGPYEDKYHDNETSGGMCTEFCVADEYAKFTHVNFGYSSDEYELDGKHVIVRYACSKDELHSTSDYSRCIFVQFKDSPYVAILHISDYYSIDEALKVCEGMELVDCTADDFTLDIWHDSGSTASHADMTDRKDDYISSYKLDLDTVDLLRIGDTFTNDWIKENVPISEFSGAPYIDITLNSARVQDNFDDITTDSCGWDRDYSIYVDENGRLNDPNYDLRIVVLDLTYTNSSDVRTDFCICPKMCSYKNGCITPIDLSPTNHHVDGVPNGFRCESGMPFSLTTDKKGDKNSVVLGAGESAEVQLAFVIEADDLGTLIYGAEPSCNSDYNDYYNSPLVDLRDLT